MNKVYARINWQNEPSLATPINETNLNAMDYALNEIDNRVINLDNSKATKTELNNSVSNINGEITVLDTKKANQSDLLNSLNGVTYNSTTGVFTFTFHNGTQVVADLNVEKIPVSFSMSADGVITMVTSDGSRFTANVADLIKTYTFNDSTDIDFTTTTDAYGNKEITAVIKDGAITEDKLQPNYLADVKAEVVNAQGSANNAQTSADNAQASALNADTSAGASQLSATMSADKALDAEAWAKGTRNGIEVDETDETFHNNAKYYAGSSEHSTLESMMDVDIVAPTDKQALVYDAEKQQWVNGDSAGKIDIDTELSTTSENPVQNKVITEVVNGIEDRVDTNAYAENGIHNLLKNTATSQTVSGVTFTVNKDGSITANGTASGDIYYRVNNNINLPQGNYIISGCPSGGSMANYFLYINSINSGSAYDVGNSSEFGITEIKSREIIISIKSGKTVSNVIFYPMIRRLDDTDTTYRPYVKSNSELTMDSEVKDYKSLSTWNTGLSTSSYILKYGKIVDLNIQSSVLLEPKKDNIVGTIPADIRPIGQIVAPAFVNGASNGMMVIRTTGEIVINPNTSSQYLGNHLTYLVK